MPVWEPDPDGTEQLLPFTQTSVLVPDANVVDPGLQVKPPEEHPAVGVILAVIGKVAVPFHLMVMLPETDPGVDGIVSVTGFGVAFVILNGFDLPANAPLTVPSCTPTTKATVTTPIRVR